MRILPFVILSLLIPVFVLCDELLLLPEDSDSTGDSYTCPASYSGTNRRCFNLIDDLFHNTTDGDLVYLIGTRYTHRDADSTFSDSYLKIQNSVSIFPNNTLGKTEIEFSRYNKSFDTGLSIDADHVHIEGLLLNASNTDGIKYVIKMDHSSAPAKRSHLLAMILRKRTTFVLTKGSCLGCMCGCGAISTPDYVRDNITIFNNTLRAALNESIGGALVYSPSNFGLSNITLYNNTMEILDEDGEVDVNPSETLYNVHFEGAYVTDGYFQQNHYGTCHYPHNVIGMCNSTQWLPYYADPEYRYLAPLFSPHNDSYYGTLEQAISLGLTELKLRGELPIEDTVDINTGVLSLSSIDRYSCCATVRVADGVNPAFHVVHETLSLSSLTFAMGNLSGLVIVRAQSPIVTPDDLLPIDDDDAGLQVDLTSILSEYALEILSDIVTPAMVPSEANIKRVLMENVHIVATDPDAPYSYGAIVMHINTESYPNITFSRISMTGGRYGIISWHGGTVVVGSYFNTTEGPSIAINSTLEADGIVLLDNTFVVRDSLVPRIAVGWNATFPNISAYLLDGNAMVGDGVGSEYPIYPSDLEHDNTYILNSTTYPDHVTFYSVTGSIPSGSGISFILGLESVHQINISLTNDLDNTAYACPNPNWHYIFVPDALPSNDDRRALPGILRSYATGVGPESNITATFSIYINDTGDYFCEELIALSRSHRSDTLESIWRSTAHYNIPPLPSVLSVRECGSIFYQAITNQLNVDVLIGSGLEVVRVCPSVTMEEEQESGGLSMSNLEDAVQHAMIGSVIVLCSNETHPIDECIQITKGLSILSDSEETRAQIECPSCCCIFDIHDENANETVIHNVHIHADAKNIGSDSCCYPAGIHVAADESGHAKQGYLEPHISNISISSVKFTNFKHAIRIGNAFNVSVESCEIEGAEGGIIILHSLTNALSFLHPLWKVFEDGSSPSYTFFWLLDNIIRNTSIGIGNMDLHESAPTPSCREFAKNSDYDTFDTVYIPPWSIERNNFSDVHTGISIRGVSGFPKYPVRISGNFFEDNIDGTVGSTDTGNLDSVGNIPAYTSSDVVSMVLESNNVVVSENYLGTNQDAILYGRNIVFDSNSLSDADIRLDPTNSKMLVSARGGFPLSNITISNNDFCGGNLTAALIHQILHLDSSTELTSVGSYGYHRVNFTANKISTLYSLFIGRDPLGFPLNLLSTSNLNCAGVRLDPDRSKGEYVLPPSTVEEDEEEESSSKRGVIHTPRGTLRNGGVWRQNRFTGFETSPIGTCESGYQPTPDGKSCEQCKVIDVNADGTVVDLRRDSPCIVFKLKTTKPPDSRVGSFWVSMLGVIFAVSIFVSLLFCVYNLTTSDDPSPNVSLAWLNEFTRRTRLRRREGDGRDLGEKNSDREDSPQVSHKGTDSAVPSSTSTAALKKKKKGGGQEITMRGTHPYSEDTHYVAVSMIPEKGFPDKPYPEHTIPISYDNRQGGYYGRM
jgi:hypothetical protein